jgi:sterol desaturase/sphingolipid hydroxylase (fatty acid hydroxylase superfamily)
MKRRSGWMFGLIVAGAIGGLMVAERRRRLRRARQGPAGERERVAENLAMAGLTAAVTQRTMAPVVEPLARWVERERVGVTQRLPVAPWAQDTVAILLLDYTLYWWHVVEHRVPWLYRFHQVHHADLELDVSTALRFHFGELVASVPWRAAQVLVIGASPRALAVWQRLLTLSVLFHHSNVRLPIDIERALARIITTPRLHGIHHSTVKADQDSNWSSGLTIWDHLHGTYRANVSQAEIEIGVPAYREPSDVTLARSLAMPLRPPPPWRHPDGTTPDHPPAKVPPTRLLP